jgi:hypothetical protein
MHQRQTLEALEGGVLHEKGSQLVVRRKCTEVTQTMRHGAVTSQSVCKAGTLQCSAPNCAMD